jgi:glycosyltransferase involved in cell wall biosynthesis
MIAPPWSLPRPACQRNQRAAPAVSKNGAAAALYLRAILTQGVLTSTGSEILTLSEPHSERRTVWVDVEDFFDYFEANPRPSGIQRLVFEMLKVLPERARLAAGEPRIAFVRHSTDTAILQEVSFAEIGRVFEGKATDRIVETGRLSPRGRGRLIWGLRRWLLDRVWSLPVEVSAVIVRAGVLQMAALRQFRELRRLHLQRPPKPPAAPAPAPVAARMQSTAGFAGQPGDILLIPGAPWSKPGYGAWLAEVRARYRLEPALLLYDLIPLRRPEWCAADLVEKFGYWLRSTLPQCPRLMAISKATAADVEAYAREAGLSLQAPVMPVPIGTDFGPPTQAGAGEPPRGLPAPGSYVLFVSTMEARKNHAMLFKVWRRLVSELPSYQVPTLVFAGRVGWLVSDLIQQLENTDWLNGKIRLIRDPTDAELTALYEGCLFTVFPSLFEGWGLPVSESLGRGQPCLISNRTSLPESGGALARYFDPEDLDDAYRAVRAVIDDPAGLEDWRAKVRRDYRHTKWEDTADAILACCLTGEPAA